MQNEPKLLLPSLRPFYDMVAELWYPVLRVATGGLLLIPGWQHYELGSAAVAANMLGRNGLPASTLLGSFLIFLEIVGGACVAMGLFTRVFAPACAILMAVIAILVQIPKGFGPPTLHILLWGVAFLAIALRGGGPYSLDRVIGTEL